MITMPDLVREHGMLLLRARLARLTCLLEHDAPVGILAAECDLIGEVARIIDPHGSAQRLASQWEYQARYGASACTEPSCEERGGHGLHNKLCEHHAAEYARIDAELAELASEDKS